MRDITNLEANIRAEHQRNWHVFLHIQKQLVANSFDWLQLVISYRTKSLLGQGTLVIGGRSYFIYLAYSPFKPFRYDRIYVNDKNIKYHDDIHLYADMSLCLYHPRIDQAVVEKIPLFKLIPGISEWIVHYQQWKKYGVWLGKEIKHRRIIEV